ncbi:MAG: type III pantothenate kinase [Candidatus Tantalella remota]|nr:type III pantothenate kinase [Candidatus Tantalella remota]
MKLLIDIGNTNTSIAVTDGGKIKKEFFLHTMKKEVDPRSLKRLLGPFAGRIEEAVIVSVVPAFLSIVKKSLKAVVPNIKVRTVGKDIKVPIRSNIRIPVKSVRIALFLPSPPRETLKLLSL